MFTFGNFSNKTKVETNEENGIYCAPSMEIKLDSCYGFPERNICRFGVNDVDIRYFDPAYIINTLLEIDSSVVEAEKNQSDLIEGVYEGGLKIWECTYDVANYLCIENKSLVSGKQVLDLGCGSGILGILAFKLEAAEVHFQDYNDSVIKFLTMPNVGINGDHLLKKSRFWCGDWKSFIEMNTSKYDVILTSETIYNPKNHNKLIMALKTLIKPNGTVILSGKSYYFGVGGGIKQFLDLVENDNFFSYESVWQFESGIKREIILMRPKGYV